MFLDRESFTINVNLARPFLFGTKKRTVRVDYQQCSLKELLQFQELLGQASFDLDMWVLNFVKSHTKDTISSREESSIYLQTVKLFHIIMDTYFKGCFHDRRKSNNKQGLASQSQIDTSPIQATIAFLAKEVSTSIIDLYEKCTIHDIDYISEGVIWNINSQTKQGQKKNRLASIAAKAKNRTPEEIEEIKKKLAKIPD